MELIDTPNPNAKKVVIDLSSPDGQKSVDGLSSDLYNVQGISSVFHGPGFITITKEEKTVWESINQDIINIFDKL